MDIPNRKPSRIGHYDYSQSGAYFITICTQHRRKILSRIVGTGVLDCPSVQLTGYGQIVEKYIRQLDAFYNHISVDNYVVMPDHIHLLIRIHSGQSRTPVPTRQNAELPKFISTLKRFCNKEYGENIWQDRYYDHVVRNQQDYNEIWEYIDNNPAKWEEDCFYEDCK